MNIGDIISYVLAKVATCIFCSDFQSSEITSALGNCRRDCQSKSHFCRQKCCQGSFRCLEKEMFTFFLLKNKMVENM